MKIKEIDFFFLVFHAISAISWGPVLVVKEGWKNHEEATGKLYHMWLWLECTLFCKHLYVSEKIPVWFISIYLEIKENDLIFFLGCLMALSAISWGPVLVVKEFLQLTNLGTHPHIGDSLVWVVRSRSQLPKVSSDMHLKILPMYLVCEPFFIRK